MSIRSFILPVFVAIGLVADGEGQGPTNIRSDTNKIGTSAVSTNLIGLVEGTHTNLILRIRLADGTHTNIFLRLDPKGTRGYKIDKIIDVSSPPAGEGDFWLPGEFERLLEEKKQQRQEQQK